MALLLLHECESSFFSNVTERLMFAKKESCDTKYATKLLYKCGFYTHLCSSYPLDVKKNRVSLVRPPTLTSQVKCDIDHNFVIVFFFFKTLSPSHVKMFLR